MFKTNIRLLPLDWAKRYASALTKITFNNRIIRRYGKKSLKDYVRSFIKDQI